MRRGGAQLALFLTIGPGIGFFLFFALKQGFALLHRLALEQVQSLLELPVFITA